MQFVGFLDQGKSISSNIPLSYVISPLHTLHKQIDHCAVRLHLHLENFRDEYFLPCHLSKSKSLYTGERCLGGKFRKKVSRPLKV